MLAQAPAVVHCARALPEGLSATLALAGSGTKYVCWLHGEELGYASTSRELTWLARRVYNRAEAVIANSRNSKNLLVGEWGVPEERVQIVHPGVETARFNPGVDGRAIRARLAHPDEIVFTSVGRLQRRKGHDAVLQALAEVRRVIPRVRYVIVGDGPHRDVLEAQSRELDLTDVVTMVGAVPDADLPAWYRAADVFVLPNRPDGVDFEGFGIVFLEAAACGLPVIGGRSGGAPEAVADGITGCLVDGTDIGELSRVMIALGLDPAGRAAMGDAGARRARSDFSWESAAARVATLSCARAQ
jgi:phosphatidylinositol alpha-1,6-mannosyltransferase